MKSPSNPLAIPLRCMHCKTWGTAHVREPKDAAGTQPPSVTVSWISTGFRVSRVGSNSIETEFRCAVCDEVAG